MCFQYRLSSVPHISILRCGIPQPSTAHSLLSTNIGCPILARFLAQGWDSTNPTLSSVILSDPERSEGESKDLRLPFLPSTQHEHRVPHPCALFAQGWDSTNPTLSSVILSDPERSEGESKNLRLPFLPSTQHEHRVPHISILRCGIPQPSTAHSLLSTNIGCPILACFFARVGQPLGWVTTHPNRPLSSLSIALP